MTQRRYPPYALRFLGTLALLGIGAVHIDQYFVVHYHVVPRDRDAVWGRRPVRLSHLSSIWRTNPIISAAGRARRRLNRR
jgi:hypothetical protein